MNGLIARTILAGSGAVLAFIGGNLMFAPNSFVQKSGISVGQDPSLMSELTAPSGLLIIAGAFMIRSAMKQHFARPALLLGAVMYGSYGIGRLVSMALHGVPSEPLVAAAIIELTAAAVLMVLRLTADFKMSVAGGGTYRGKVAT